MTARVRRLALVALLAAGCSTATAPAGGGSTPAAGGGAVSGGGAASSPDGGGGGSGGGSPSGVADAAAALTKVCSVMPTDLVRSLVPKAGDPVEDAAYHQCTMSDGTSAIQITIMGGFGPVDPPVPAQTVDGLGEHAWLQEQTTDDAYLVVDLGATQTQSYETLYVEFAGHDGKSHKDDAIAVAKATLGLVQ